MRRQILALFLSLVVISPLSAGVVFEIETQDHDYSPAQLERTSVQAQGVLLKMESAQGQRGNADTVIYRGDRREMVVVDHTRQSYMVIDRQFVDTMVGQLGQAASQMPGMLDNVPPEQRAMFEQMAKQRLPAGQTQAKPIIQVSNTGQQSNVYGYPCTLFTVSRNGRKVRDVWVTNWNNINGAGNLAQSFASMSSFFQELTSALPAQANSPLEDNVFATMKELGGFPVATREYREDGSLKSESALRSAKQLSINPAVFEAPQGYRAESMLGGNASLSGPSQPTRQYGQSGR